MNVVPIQSPLEQPTATCTNCASPVLADQRYCLKCGQPCSPVRLAFLDVLQAESQVRPPAAFATAPATYLAVPPAASSRQESWLRRYSGLLSLVSILLTTGLIGLLIGHWLTPAKAPATQVIKVQGSGLPLAGTGQDTTTSGSSTTSSSSTAGKQSIGASSSKATEAQEKREVEEAESPKAKAPAPVKTSSSDLQKISKLNGKQHEQAIEKLVAGDKPIETGG
jgi:hypothetical protein